MRVRPLKGCVWLSHGSIPHSHPDHHNKDALLCLPMKLTRSLRNSMSSRFSFKMSTQVISPQQIADQFPLYWKPRSPPEKCFQGTDKGKCRGIFISLHCPSYKRGNWASHLPSLLLAQSRWIWYQRPFLTMMAFHWKDSLYAPWVVFSFKSGQSYCLFETWWLNEDKTVSSSLPITSGIWRKITCLASALGLDIWDRDVSTG